MLHENKPQASGPDKASDAKARLGMILFLVYCVIYAGFVALNTLKPTAMEARGMFGTNLAVTYGFGLIVLAIVMGLVYNAQCTRMENRMNAAAGDPK